MKDKTADTQTLLSDKKVNHSDVFGWSDGSTFWYLEKDIKQTLSKTMNEIDGIAYFNIQEFNIINKVKEIVTANFGKDFFSEKETKE